MLSKDGEIRRDEGCMDYAGKFVMIYPCHSMKGNQEWVYGQVRPTTFHMFTIINKLLLLTGCCYLSPGQHDTSQEHELMYRTGRGWRENPDEAVHWDPETDLELETSRTK